jgi:MFS transporter, ACS family, glucarate transporter
VVTHSIETGTSSQSEHRSRHVTLVETAVSETIFLNPIESSPPSPRRWLILGLLFSISVVTYIDRINISVTARHMMPALGLTEQEMGLVFSAFVVGYALFQIPGGWLSDRWGIRIVLMIALIWWSCFTAWTATAATSFLAGPLGIVGALALIRFLLGVGEAAALPAFNRAVASASPSAGLGSAQPLPLQSRLGLW